MRRRTTQLRERVVVTAVVAFVLLWTAVFVQMATGNDPAIDAGKAAKRPAWMAAARSRERSSSPQTTPPEGRTEAAETEQIELEAVTSGQS